MHLQNLFSAAIVVASFAPHIVSAQCIKVTGKLTIYGDIWGRSTFHLEDKTGGRTGCDYRGEDHARYWHHLDNKGGFDGLCNGQDGNIKISVDGKQVEYFFKNGTAPVKWTNKVFTAENKQDNSKTSNFEGDNGKC